VPFKTNPAIPPAMMAQYEGEKRDAFLRTGNMEQAQKSALSALQRVWGQSSINGSPGWMMSPPENFYSAPAQYALTPEQNTEWMRQQLVSEFTADGALIDETAGPVADRLTLIPSNQVGPDGKPVYNVMFRDSMGAIGPAVDAQGRAMLWAPDWEKSSRKQELDGARQKEIDLLKQGANPNLPYSDDAKLALAGAGESTIPVNMRQFAYHIAGGTQDLTEKDLQPSDTDALKRAVLRDAQKSGKDSGTIGYGDYGETPGEFSDFDYDNAGGEGIGKAIVSSFTDPKFRMETTIGMATWRKDKSGNIIIEDRYNFNATRKQVEDALKDKSKSAVLMDAWSKKGYVGVINALGNMFGSTDDEPGNRVRINLGKIDLGAK
jgi:hypothetical protein